MSAGAETLKARATYEVRAWLALLALLVALFAAIAVTRITTKPTAITRPNAVVSVDSVGQANPYDLNRGATGPNASISDVG